MSLRVEAHIGEDLADTLDRFSQLVQRDYEPPSALRRKRSKMRRLRRRSSGGLWLRIDIATQLRRTGPANAAGH
jgi:hypothetical protein